MDIEKAVFHRSLINEPDSDEEGPRARPIDDGDSAARYLENHENESAFNLTLVPWFAAVSRERVRKQTWLPWLMAWAVVEAVLHKLLHQQPQMQLLQQPRQQSLPLIHCLGLLGCTTPGQRE